MSAIINLEKAMEKKAAEGKAPQYDIVFYGTKDVARMLNCSIPTARTVMRRADFPLIMVGTNLKVSKPAFEKWTMEKRV